MGSDMSKQTKLLIEFRKYEKELYNYFFGIPDIKEDIPFYFIPKDYIDAFLSKFNFATFTNDLDEIITYNDPSETKDKDLTDDIKKIRENLIKNLEDKIDKDLKMEKINNKKLLEKFESKDTFFIKLGKEGSFVPLTKNIWELFCDYYDTDETLSKTGFVNDGEIFILTEEEKKIDCFFTLIYTKDVIYHYVFIMDNFDEYKKVKIHFKNKGPHFSARYLIGVSKIDIKNVNSWQKFKIKVPGSVGNIGNFDITIFFMDSFKFNNYEGRNYDNFENKHFMEFASYRNHNDKINNSVNSFHNN
jgi:hypothetical protein